jgi:hypothetical protein
MKPAQIASKLRQIATAIDNSKNPCRDLVEQDLRRVIAAVEEECFMCGGPLDPRNPGKIDICPKCCDHSKTSESGYESYEDFYEGDITYCGKCGGAIGKGFVPKPRTWAERDADEAQTQWEKWRGI